MKFLPAFLIIGVQVLIFSAVLGIVIYLIVKRVNEKRNEDFEKRDN